ncbi:gliding motility-associated C-terminal domain-containing protein [Brumimicrobium glaciale]|uniref:Gliding motility-associated C-terminal domain-containing protein n=1 Tax=Brumimicrobium glaciale TaxID=200475 RepID=A0A4V1WFR1_9FLAO|nr:gliding motility-associated C-terminal domain-containing protein [Brumimicrobium glaciale]RYM34076.1 gliding motility-associated C-terminal domain-containing protein [Brumimicrobium glaciale]
MKSIFLLVALLFCVFTLQAQSPCNINFSIGNDSTLLCGQTYTLQANQGLDSYAWSTGSSQSSITVSTSGTYSCFATDLGPEIVVNGDFSAGNTGFTTGYTLGVPGGTYGLLSNPGTYAITTSPSNAHNNFSSCPDHTTGTGNMMVVNGADIPGTNVWCQTVNVSPNTNYQFSTWAANALNDPNVAQLQFSINGTTLGTPFSTATNACTWNQFFEVWNSGANTSIDICITNLNSSGGGNDFSIDDISFRPVCTYTDQVTVTIPPNPVIQVNSAQTICEGDNVDITASSVSSNMTYTWTPGGAGATINVSPNATTSYTVVGEDANGCISNTGTVVVNVNPLPVLTFEGDSVICEGTAGLIKVISSIPQTDFLWTNNNLTLATITVAPSTTTIYEVTATSPQGCVATAEFEMTVLEELEVEIEGNTVFCEGDQNSLQAISNLTETDFLWLPRNETTPVLSTTIADIGWVYLEGTHPVCGTEIDSIQLVLGEKPLVSLPDSVNLCLGDEANLVAVSSIPNSEFTWFPNNLIGASQMLSPSESSYFYVQANVGGCKSDLDSVFISVNPNCDVEVPNVFTPNSDGINDYFKLISFEGIQQLECVIVNRWGNLVREFDTPDFKWDGTDKKGNKITNGTFFYVIKAKTITGEDVDKSGFVQLIDN